MSLLLLPAGAQQAIEKLGRAEIVIGIPSYNNAATIGHVVQAAQAGLAKYFPQLTSVIVNSDGGSKDSTRGVVLSAEVEDAHVLLVDTPRSTAQRLSFPYHGIPGKGSAFRLIFQMASALGAKACAVVDSDLRSITPEWIDLLLRPVMHSGYDFVAPYYHRHKFDGTITNSIVYPLTRALYGKRLRQPIGGEFGLSNRMFSHYLARDDWESDVARFGIDIWMTTIAVAEGYNVCQSFLGAKLHDAKDPGSDLSSMLQQVVGSVFTLMNEYQNTWLSRSGSEGTDLFGFRYGVGLDPIEVNVQRMIDTFHRGKEDLREIWEGTLSPEILSRILQLPRATRSGDTTFHLGDEVWTKAVYDFACASRSRPLERGVIVKSLTPLYMARVASWVLESRDLVSDEVEERVEALCQSFEGLKPYLVNRWLDRSPAPEEAAKPKAEKPKPERMEV